jgi:hypothetical protein
MPELSIVGWNEIFLNLNDTDWGAQSGFDQNRLFAGPGYGFTPMLRVQAGYLNRYVDTPTIDRRNDEFATTVGMNFWPTDRARIQSLSPSHQPADPSRTNRAAEARNSACE